MNPNQPREHYPRVLPSVPLENAYVYATAHPDRIRAYCVRCGMIAGHTGRAITPRPPKGKRPPTRRARRIPIDQRPMPPAFVVPLASVPTLPPPALSGLVERNPYATAPLPPPPLPPPPSTPIVPPSGNAAAP